MQLYAAQGGRGGGGGQGGGKGSIVLSLVYKQYPPVFPGITGAVADFSQAALLTTPSKSLVDLYSNDRQLGMLLHVCTAQVILSRPLLPVMSNPQMSPSGKTLYPGTVTQIVFCPEAPEGQQVSGEGPKSPVSCVKHAYVIR